MIYSEWGSASGTSGYYTPRGLLRWYSKEIPPPPPPFFPPVFGVRRGGQKWIYALPPTSAPSRKGIGQGGDGILRGSLQCCKINPPPPPTHLLGLGWAGTLSRGSGGGGGGVWGRFGYYTPRGSLLYYSEEIPFLLPLGLGWARRGGGGVVRNMLVFRTESLWLLCYWKKKYPSPHLLGLGWAGRGGGVDYACFFGQKWISYAPPPNPFGFRRGGGGIWPAWCLVF